MRSRRLPLALLVGGAFMIATGAPWARANEADKSGYNLFNPTPRDLMRDLSTDRPDKTESAYTVDAGHFQIETDVVSFTFDRFNGDPTDTQVEDWSFANANFKIGLFNNVDFQLVVPTYNHVRVEDREARMATEDSGFGELTARLKVNLWGNDGGRTAFALMPFVKFPTAADGLGNGAVEGGLIVPLGVALPGDWQMGVMTEFDFNQDGSGSGYHVEFINSITFSHAIVGKLGGYAEFFSAVSTEDGSDWVGVAAAGLTFGLTDNIQFDAGVNFGLTRSADDVNPFLGASFRF